MENMDRNKRRLRYGGFTLIELSIVLVIIGLLVGGVLVGRDLIRAAEVRAQISQIEKFQAAVNTFKVKYNHLPGDIPDPDASNFGFQPRGLDYCNNAAKGDGNGIIQGISGANSCAVSGVFQNGEPLMFWRDLSTVRLIEGGFNTVAPYPLASTVPGTLLNGYYPPAKLGQGSYVAIYSGGANVSMNNVGDGQNYFNVTGISSLTLAQDYSTIAPFMGITVAQAYAIDAKVDDGFPQSGNIMAMGLWGVHVCAAGQGYCNSPLLTGATAAGAATCYDNGNVAGATQRYSINQNNGNGINCVLSFKFQ